MTQMKKVAIVTGASQGMGEAIVNAFRAKGYGVAAFHPMNKLGEVEDIVRAVLYLEDAAFSTGEILHVDGGLIAGR